MTMIETMVRGTGKMLGSDVRVITKTYSQCVPFV